MNNCLVTNLKGSVQNDNLPKYNTIVLDYNGLVASPSIVIGAKEENKVTVKSKVPFKMGSASSSVTFTERVINESLTVMAFDTLAAGTPVDEVIEITGAYSLAHLAIYAPTTFNANSKMKSGMSSLQNSDNIVGISWYDDVAPTALADGTRGLLINLPANKNVEALPAVPLEFITSQAISGAYQFVNIDAIKNISSLRVAALRLSGNIEDLPLNIKSIVAGTGSLTGSVESLVAKMRANGKTSGAIMFIDYNGWAFTYNGTPVGQQIVTTIPSVMTSVGSKIILTWDASSISWASVVPDSLIDYTAITSYFSYFNKFPTTPVD